MLPINVFFLTNSYIDIPRQYIIYQIFPGIIYYIPDIPRQYILYTRYSKAIHIIPIYTKMV